MASANPDFEMSLSRTSLHVRRGSTIGSIAVRLASVGGFSGEIRMISEVSPSGPILSMPDSIELAAGRTVNTTLNISVPRSIRGGVYYVRIVGDCGLTHSAVLALFVT
ncbi:MAG TPA: hypothetical protein VFE96_08930 [Candidatus Bathyarchaeia archaeon]|jgi:hypothetical protein|nr:hypothetical protein [Candidatus Bathyarchaeia archaeon]